MTHVQNFHDQVQLQDLCLYRLYRYSQKLVVVLKGHPTSFFQESPAMLHFDIESEILLRSVGALVLLEDVQLSHCDDLG